MKRIALIIAVLAAALMPCQAQQLNPHEKEFREFYTTFLTAVRANDKDKLAGLIAFPVQDWSVEKKGNVNTISIKDKTEFLAGYNSFITASMRSHVPRAKLATLKDGRYALIWQDADAEFSFEFDYKDGSGYRVTSFSIGPL